MLLFRTELNLQHHIVPFPPLLLLSFLKHLLVSIIYLTVLLFFFRCKGSTLPAISSQLLSQNSKPPFLVAGHNLSRL